MSSCLPPRIFLVYIPVGDMHFDRVSRCPCKNGPACRFCGYCQGCSCRCHTWFTLNCRFHDGDGEKALLEQVEGLVVPPSSLSSSSASPEPISPSTETTDVTSTSTTEAAATTETTEMVGTASVTAASPTVETKTTAETALESASASLTPPQAKTKEEIEQLFLQDQAYTEVRLEMASRLFQRQQFCFIGPPPPPPPPPTSPTAAAPPPPPPLPQP